MRLLDLFCGAGGAAMGYHQAIPDLEIVGVDIKPQPHYPFDFVKADALSFPLDGFDIIHASPPCQAHSSSGGHNHETWDYLLTTLRRLRETEALWVVENVMGAQVKEHFRLCGSGLGLVLPDERWYLQRHRKFWSSAQIASSECRCADYKRMGYTCAGVYGGSSPPTTTGRFRGFRPGADGARKLMQIDWMNRRELAQSIPPAFTRYILTQALGNGPALIDRGHLELPSLNRPNCE